MIVRSLIFLAVSVLFAAAIAQSGESDKGLPTPEAILKSYGIGSGTSELIAALTNAEPEVRHNAVLVLAKRNEKSTILEIRKLLKDDYFYSRLAAAGALVQMGDASGEPVLLSALDEKNPAEAIYAANTLTGLGKASGSEVIARIAKTAEQPLDRLQAVRAMGRMARFSDLEPAINSLLIDRLFNDSDLRVRRAAADEMQHFHRAETVAAFNKAVRDSDPVIRGLAERYLGGRAQKK